MISDPNQLDKVIYVGHFVAEVILCCIVIVIADFLIAVGKDIWKKKWGKNDQEK